jgi:hypothetical protein
MGAVKGGIGGGKHPMLKTEYKNYPQCLANSVTDLPAPQNAFTKFASNTAINAEENLRNRNKTLFNY